MSEKDKKYQRGDEYQFPHDEYVASEETQDHSNAFQDHQDDQTPSAEHQPTEEPASPPNSLLDRFPILKNRRLLTVVGTALVALIAFHIMSPSPTVRIVKPAQPISQSPSLAQQQQRSLANQLNGIQKSASNNQATVSQLQNQVKGLHSALNQSNANNETMKSAVIALAKQVQGLSTALKKATTAPHHIKRLPPSPILVFNLRAVTSGRAWVSGSNGESDTVTIGSHLKDYGTVKAIDADVGKVFTSSGKVITYNASGN